MLDDTADRKLNVITNKGVRTNELITKTTIYHVYRSWPCEGIRFAIPHDDGIVLSNIDSVTLSLST